MKILNIKTLISLLLLMVVFSSCLTDPLKDFDETNKANLEQLTQMNIHLDSTLKDFRQMHSRLKEMGKEIEALEREVAILERQNQ